MSATQDAFEPAELIGLHYRSIGGSYGSIDLAVEGVKAYNRNKHGGGAACRVYKDGDLSIVEFGLNDSNPQVIQSLYKVFVRHLGS